jgi:two-component sensor histidine kinase
MKFCLIIGELVTNSLKHGLGSKRKMPLILSMGSDPDDDELFSLAYMDEGLGINEDIDMSKNEQYGLSIAHSIMLSLDGKFDISSFYDGGIGIQCKIDKNKLQEFYS